MAIKSVEGKGVNRAVAVCDDCDREETVTCDYLRAANGQWSPNEGQVKKKITQHGWTDVKGKLRCPSCETKRKIVPMKPEPKPVDESIPTPTLKERQAIMKMLSEVYDTEAARYIEAETDDSVASVLEVRPGWVAEIREQFFGPDGGNAELDEAVKDLEAMVERLHGMHDQANSAASQARVAMAEADELKKKVEKITSALSTRVLKKAGVA